MRHLTLLFGALAASCCVAPLLADTTSLQSILINANGTQYTNENSVPGVNTGSWNGTTGLGTLTFTFSPGPGTYFFDVFFDHQLNLPFFNEFGTVLGAPSAGQSYEIGDSFASNIYPDVLAGGALSNTNSLAGQASNFNNACVGANCNGDFAAALGFSFTLAAGEQEVITFSVSHTDPGSGLRLKDTHPVDAANPTALALYISGSAAACDLTDPTCGGGGGGGGGGGNVPEPFSLVLLGTTVVVLMVAYRGRLAPSVK
jgi:hypothetical protein